MEVQFNTDRTVSLLPPPKRPKKITGTRLAAVLGQNRWQTPFQAWCEITKAYCLPYEDNKYTIAGKAIEPKQIAYMRSAYGMNNLIAPADVWGKDYFSKTYGNFYTHKVFGGMWDALLVEDTWDGTEDGLKGNVEAVLEFKTTKRAEDWDDDGIPENYALQAALYAWLLQCDTVIMVASFLEDADYDRPEDYEPNAGNTITRVFHVSERYPDFITDYVDKAEQWWEKHVLTGESPQYSERADADYLGPLRTANLNPTSDIDALLRELRDLNTEVSIVEKQIAAKSKRITAIKGQLKKYAQERIGDNDKATIQGEGVTCTLTKSVSFKVNEDALKDAGIWDEYAHEVTSERFTVKYA